MKEGEHLSFKKCVRKFFYANLLLLVVYTFLPILILYPDLEIFQSSLSHLNKD